MKIVGFQFLLPASPLILVPDWQIWGLGAYAKHGTIETGFIALPPFSLQWVHWAVACPLLVVGWKGLGDKTNLGSNSGFTPSVSCVAFVVFLPLNRTSNEHPAPQHRPEESVMVGRRQALDKACDLLLCQAGPWGLLFPVQRVLSAQCY